MTTATTAPDAAMLRGGRSTRRGDIVFHGLALCAGALVFVVLAAIAIFLVVKALPALHHDKSSFWTTQAWDPANSGKFGIAALLFGTVLTSLLALVMAVPVGIGVALYVTQYAPRRLAS